MTEPEKPEALFDGVEWVDISTRPGVICWHASISGIDVELVPPKVGEKTWVASFVDDPLSGHPGERDALTWLRTKVIEARDELCRVTGTAQAVKEAEPPKNAQEESPWGIGKSITPEGIEFLRVWAVVHGDKPRTFLDHGFGPGIVRRRYVDGRFEMEPGALTIGMLAERDRKLCKALKQANETAEGYITGRKPNSLEVQTMRRNLAELCGGGK